MNFSVLERTKGRIQRLTRYWRELETVSRTDQTTSRTRMIKKGVTPLNNTNLTNGGRQSGKRYWTLVRNSANCAKKRPRCAKTYMHRQPVRDICIRGTYLQSLT